MEPGFKITELTAFIATEEDGTEGVIGIYTPNGWLPAVGADTKRIEALRPIVEEISKDRGIPIVMARFSSRVNIETIGE